MHGKKKNHKIRHKNHLYVVHHSTGTCKRLIMHMACKTKLLKTRCEYLLYKQSYMTQLIFKLSEYQKLIKSDNEQHATM